MALNRARTFLDRARRAGNRSSLNRAVESALRLQTYTLDWEHAERILDSSAVDFLDASERPKHWAETDGQSIWLSPLKPWCDEALYYTLLHEAMHGLVKRDDGSEVSDSIA
jgi:hypothetical protein